MSEQVRVWRLRISGLLYRVAWRIDPGDDPNEPKCVACGYALLSDGDCWNCSDQRDREEMLREEYDQGQRDAWRDAEHEFGVAP